MFLAGLLLLFLSVPPANAARSSIQPSQPQPHPLPLPRSQEISLRYKAEQKEAQPPHPDVVSVSGESGYI